MARTQPKKMEHMQEVPLFSKLTGRQLRRVAKHVDEVTVKAGKVLSREDGRGGKELLVIVEGKLRVSRKGRTLAQLGPGDLVGEMSLLDGAPLSATVTAETDATLLTIGPREFRGLLDDVPGLKDKIMLTLVERLRAADEKIVC